MNIAILFISCLASFAATVISLLFFLRYKKIFFFDVLLVLLSFFALSTESFFVSIRNAGITNIVFLSIIGLFLGFCFSYGITSLAFDLIRVSTNAFVRKVPLFYSILFTVAGIVLAVCFKDSSLLSTIINISGIWVPAGIAVLIAIIFYKRIDSGVFKKEKWIFIALALINLVFAFVIKEVPFVFIISISLLVFYIFYRFYFAAPVNKTQKSLSPEFIKNFSITPREQEIILALLEGKSNKELAQALFVSEKTIETHLGNIYKKIGVKNRLELFSRLQNDL